MGERFRLKITKWRDLLVVFGIYAALVLMLLKNNETLGEVTATNVFLAKGRETNEAGIKALDARIDTQSIVMVRVVNALDKLEKRQAQSEENQLNTDVEIIRLLKLNNLLPYRWKDVTILPKIPTEKK
jgi:hypothetical protein